MLSPSSSSYHGNVQQLSYFWCASTCVRLSRSSYMDNPSPRTGIHNYLLLNLCRPHRNRNSNSLRRIPLYLSTLSTNPSAPTSSTIPLHPPPHTTGIIGWAQFGPLAVVGALVPLSIPRPFLVPTSNNMNETESPSPNTEETASYLSLLTLFYLDPIIWKAFRVPHLGVFPWPLHRNLLRSVSAM